MKPSDIRCSYDKSFVYAVRDRLNICGLHLKVFDCKYLEGMQAEEVASKLNISVHTVYKIQGSINRKLTFINIRECEGY